MARKLLPLRPWLVKILRKASMRWQGKSVARDQAAIYVPAGNFKNGKPKSKLMFKCARCQKLVDREGGAMDHINPVVSVRDGFTTWDSYINSLFCDPSNYQHLCHACHGGKTKAENNERKNFKSYKRKKKVTKFKASFKKRRKNRHLKYK